MYQPNKPDAIWVPVGKLNWAWWVTAVTTDGLESWEMSAGAHDVENPAGNATTEFPQWPDKISAGHPTWKPD